MSKSKELIAAVDAAVKAFHAHSSTHGPDGRARGEELVLLGQLSALSNRVALENYSDVNAEAADELMLLLAASEQPLAEGNLPKEMNRARELTSTLLGKSHPASEAADQTGAIAGGKAVAIWTSRQPISFKKSRRSSTETDLEEVRV